MPFDEADEEAEGRSVPFLNDHPEGTEIRGVGNQVLYGPYIVLGVPVPGQRDNVVPFRDVFHGLGQFMVQEHVAVIAAMASSFCSTAWSMASPDETRTRGRRARGGGPAGGQLRQLLPEQGLQRLTAQEDAPAWSMAGAVKRSLTTSRRRRRYGPSPPDGGKTGEGKRSASGTSRIPRRIRALLG